jgi:putative phosphoesterase
MKLAIISDIHGNIPYLEKAIEILGNEKAETVICCGDVQTKEAFEMLDTIKIPVYLAWGNADYYLQDAVEKGFLEPKHMKIFEDFGEIELGGKKIGFTHYDFLARKLAATEDFDIVFYGHRHTPWTQMVGKTITLNPGEVAAQYGRPTMAIFDLNQMKADLKVLNLD